MTLKPLRFSERATLAVPQNGSHALPPTIPRARSTRLMKSRGLVLFPIYLTILNIGPLHHFCYVGVRSDERRVTAQRGAHPARAPKLSAWPCSTAVALPARGRGRR